MYERYVYEMLQYGGFSNPKIGDAIRSCAYFGENKNLNNESIK